jgi:hypothetical protein
LGSSSSLFYFFNCPGTFGDSLSAPVRLETLYTFSGTSAIN